MKKKFQTTPSSADDALKFKTLNALNYIVLIAFTASSAALYVKKEDASASVIRRGNGNDLDTITKSSAISVADYGFNDTAIIVSTSNHTDLVFRNTDDSISPAKGAILFYGKPSGRKIHVRIVCNRASNGICDQFAINDIDELWMLRSIVEPLLVSWGFRFSWVRFVEYIYGVTIIIKDENSEANNGRA